MLMQCAHLSCSPRRWLLKYVVLQSAPRELWVVFFMKFLESFAYFSSSFTLVLLLSRDFGMSDEEAGLAYGALNGLTALYGIPAGIFLIDNLGVKRSLVLGGIVLLVARTMLSLTANLLWLNVCLYGLLPFGQALAIPVMTIAIRRYTYEQESRSLSFSLFYVIMNVGALLAAPLVDGVRLSAPNGLDWGLFGLATLSQYRIINLVGACCTLVNVLMALLCVREINVRRPGEVSKFTPKSESPMSTLRSVMCASGFWRFVFFLLLLTGVRLIYRHMDSTFPKFMVREFGDKAPYGSILAINPFMIIALVPLISAATAGFGSYKMIVYGSFVSGLSPFVFLAGSSYLTASLWVIILSLGEAVWSPRLYEYCAMVAPAGKEGVYMSMSSVPLFAAPIVAGGMSGSLLERYCPTEGVCNGPMLWGIVGIASASSPVLMVLFAKVIQGDLAARDKGEVQSDETDSAPLMSEETDASSLADEYALV